MKTTSEAQQPPPSVPEGEAAGLPARRDDVKEAGVGGLGRRALPHLRFTNTDRERGRDGEMAAGSINVWHGMVWC